ncbi:MAG: SNARE domain-containing protein [archaeon]|nr:SNARE domain-containing protein [archaeon]
MSNNNVDNFRGKIAEFKSTEEEIQKYLTSLTNNFNFINLQKSEKLISKLKTEISSMRTQYRKKDAAFIGLLPEKEYRLRVDEINLISSRCDSYESSLKKFKDDKYKSTLDPSAFKESEEVRNMSRSEYLMYQQKKLAEQDELIDRMYEVNKENKALGKEMNEQISNQINQLDTIQTQMDKVGNKMNKTNNRFKEFIDTQSNCKLYVIIIIQALIIVFLITIL